MKLAGDSSHSYKTISCPSCGKTVSLLDDRCENCGEPLGYSEGEEKEVERKTILRTSKRNTSLICNNCYTRLTTPAIFVRLDEEGHTRCPSCKTKFSLRRRLIEDAKNIADRISDAEEVEEIALDSIKRDQRELVGALEKNDYRAAMDMVDDLIVDSLSVYKLYKLLPKIRERKEKVSEEIDLEEVNKKIDKLSLKSKNGLYLDALFEEGVSLADDLLSKKTKSELIPKEEEPEVEEEVREPPKIGLSQLITPMYSFAVPVFLALFVALEFFLFLVVYPLSQPSSLILHLTPSPFFIGEELVSILLSFIVTAILFLTTYRAFEFDTTAFKIERRKLSFPLVISGSIASSLMIDVYLTPFSIELVPEYVLFFMVLFHSAVILDIIINHKKLRKGGPSKEKSESAERKGSVPERKVLKKRENPTNTDTIKPLRAIKRAKSGMDKPLLRKSLLFLIIFSLTVTLIIPAVGQPLRSREPDEAERESEKENQKIDKDDRRSEDQNRSSNETNSTHRVEPVEEKSGPSLQLSDPATELDNLTQGRGEESNGRFGWNVSSLGDVNGDGYKDFIIGAPNNDSDDSGAAFVYFGYEQLDEYLGNYINSSDANVSIFGNAAGGHLGWDVSGVGDINGDGYDDIIVGEPDNGSGHAYVFYGRKTWSSSYTSNEADVTIQGESSGDKFGFSVDGGIDMDDDGYDDLAVGAPHNSTYSASTPGAAYALNGSTSLSTNYNAGDSEIDKLSSGRSRNETFGFSVSAAGDLNGDGYGDLAVGAPSVDETFVYYGDSEGYLLEKTNTTVPEFENGTTYHTQVKENGTTPPANNGDVKLANKTSADNLYDVDNNGTIYDQEESTGDFNDTLEKDDDMWNIKEAGGKVNATANGETTVNGTRINDLTYTEESDDEYEVLEEEETENHTYWDFEGDVSGWSTSGLWHRVDESDTYGDSNSPTHSFWYGQDSTGDYDTGAQTTGTLDAPLVNLSKATNPKLEFYHWYETEDYDGEYDICEVTVNGDVVYHRDSSDPNVGSEDDFVKETIDLSAYVGEVIDVEFVFDSVDDMYNTYRGWYVDDVNITGLSTTSNLEHFWEFSIPESSNVKFNLEAYHTDLGVTENFTFYYSSTGTGYVGTSGWTEMLTVTNTSDEDYNWTFTSDTLNNTDGNIYVGVIDTDRTLGYNSTDSLYIDRIWFNCSGSSSYYDINFGFDNLGSTYNRKTMFTFYGYEENDDCNVTVWDNSTNDWVEIPDIEIKANEGWYNSSFNLTDYIFDEDGGRLVIRLNKSKDANADAWIHVDYLGLRFDPYINNGTFYSSIAKLVNPIDRVSVSWDASNTTSSPSNFDVYVSANGGGDWEEVDKPGEKVYFSSSGQELMYRCEFQLLNRDYSAVLHSVTLSHPSKSNILYGHNETDFGWSLSGGEDVNGDDYDELLVGAPVRDGNESRLKFKDDFEDGDLYDPDWTRDETGGGDVSVTTETSGSGQYSMRTGEDVCSVASKKVNLSLASTVKIRAWIRRGDDGFSENPETGEDLEVYYLDRNDNWVLLDTFLGGGTAGQIYDASYTLGNDAAYSSLRLRFNQTGGSGAGFDYWHIDDVYVNYTYENSEGRAYLFNGSADGVSQDGGKGTADVIATGSKPGDNFSYSVGMGDLDDDGFADLYVGAPYNRTGRGAGYVFKGSSTMQASLQVGDAEYYKYGNESGGRFGFSVGAVDLPVTPNTKANPIIGAPTADTGGKTYVLRLPYTEPQIQFRSIYQGGDNVTAWDGSVYNASGNCLNLTVNSSVGPSWDHFRHLNITGWVDNGLIGGSSTYPELDYPNTRWFVSYNGSGWSLESDHPNNEVFINSSVLNFKDRFSENWTLSLYLGNQTRHTINNGSSGGWGSKDTPNTWDINWNLTASDDRNTSVSNEMGISKFCSIWTKNNDLKVTGSVGETVYPSQSGKNPNVTYSANYDYNLTVFPTDYLDHVKYWDKIGLENISVQTASIGWTPMVNNELGEGSGSEVDLLGGTQAAPNSGREQTVEVSWRATIPIGTTAGRYRSENIVYRVENW